MDGINLLFTGLDAGSIRERGMEVDVITCDLRPSLDDSLKEVHNIREFIRISCFNPEKPRIILLKISKKDGEEVEKLSSDTFGCILQKVTVTIMVMVAAQRADVKNVITMIIDSDYRCLIKTKIPSRSGSCKTQPSGFNWFKPSFNRFYRSNWGNISLPM